MPRKPNLMDPDFEPTDAELENLMKGFIDDVRAQRGGVKDASPRRQIEQDFLSAGIGHDPRVRRRDDRDQS